MQKLRQGAGHSHKRPLPSWQFHFIIDGSWPGTARLSAPNRSFGWIIGESPENVGRTVKAVNSEPTLMPARLVERFVVIVGFRGCQLFEVCISLYTVAARNTKLPIGLNL
jgi:hypothetical protein